MIKLPMILPSRLYNQFAPDNEIDVIDGIVTSIFLQVFMMRRLPLTTIVFLCVASKSEDNFDATINPNRSINIGKVVNQ